GLAINLPGPVGCEELAEILPCGSAHPGAAVRQFVRPHEHLEIFFGSDVRPGFQQGAVQAALGENLRCHASAGTGADDAYIVQFRSEEHTSELQSRGHLVCRLLLEKKKKKEKSIVITYTITMTSIAALCILK